MLFDITVVGPQALNKQTESFGNWEFWEGINPLIPLCLRPYECA